MDAEENVVVVDTRAISTLPIAGPSVVLRVSHCYPNSSHNLRINDEILRVVGLLIGC